MKSIEKQAMAFYEEEMALTHHSKLPMQTTFPLHPAQNEVFRAQVINRGNPFYNIGAYVKLTGLLCKETFKKAASTAPAVFDAFRMRFDVNEAEAVCFFETGYDTMEIKELDFSHCLHPMEEAGRWVQQRFNVAFEIKKEKQLFENILIKIAADEHWFFMRYHHLIMDGYGFKVWLRYLATKYKLLVSGDETPLSYPHYVTEISKAYEYRNSPSYQQECLYWKERMAEKPKRLLQSKHHHYHGRKASMFTCHLTESQRKMLQDLQVKTQTSIQHLTIAALLIYFGKITGEADFVFGILLHKRESRQMRNVVGMFSDILPFKGSFDANAKLLDFLKEITLQQKRDYRHKNYLAGDTSRHLHLNPVNENLCDIVVNYELFNFELNFHSEIQACVMQLSSEYERIPLQICWQEFGNQQPLQLQLLFRNDYFTHNEITLLTQRLLFIIEQFPIKFEEEVGSINIVPDEEAQLLQAFNDTAADYPTDKTLVDLFELQVTKTPARIAVAIDEEQLTYQQLNEKANQLAHYLKKKGVRERTLVPICIERSLEMIVGILGILKSGGTYVPVDPAYPQERICYMIKDTKARIILTSTFNQSLLPVRENIDTIRMDKDWPLIAKQPLSNLPLRRSTSNLVYVIYTSGSTGKPKGVQMPGSNLVNLLMWQEKQFNHSYRRVLQFASLNFDVSFQEIFSTLCFGSSLYLIKESQRSDMHKLSSAISLYGITHLFLPCIVLKSFAEYIISKSINHLPVKTIIVAGEQLQLTNDIKQLLDSSGITLINQYGPTEAHVVSSYIIDQHDIPSTVPPIGKPIGNTCLYVLDSRLRLLPPGIAGEICIAGAGVAKGYLHNKRLTAEKFVANPFGHDKMYRTGDIGRWLPNGNLEFLGRMDDQVKIRGYRIELGEIENVLQQCRFVHQCVVIAREAGDGTKHIVCYVVPKQHFDRNAIVAFLETQLPIYMIPSRFIPLLALPVTINGKIDKNALPLPDSLMAYDYVAPKTAMEATLVKIWQEVLGIEQVSIQDNFFELGGHSLLVVNTISKIKQQTGSDMQPGSLFQHPTVEKYAAFLLEQHPSVKVKHIIPIKGGCGKMPLYIICHIGVAPLSRFIPFAGMLDENQPVYGIQLPEVSELDINSISVEGIAATYVADLLAHDPQGPYAFAGYSIGGIIAVEMAKQLEKKGKKVAILCLFDTIAYIREVPEPATNINAIGKKQFQLYDRLKKMAFTLYYKIDNDLYLLKFDTKNTLESKKNRLIRKIKKLLKLNITENSKAETHALWKDVQELSMAAYKKYEPVPYGGNIILFRAKRRTFYFTDSTFLGWKRYARSVKVYETEGNHYTMFSPAHCKQLAKLVQQCLDGCNDKHSSAPAKK